MTEPIKLQPPLTDEVVEKLKTGDRVEITGVIYTARDMAHKKMVDGHQKGEPLPFDPEGQIIYYTGPTPAAPGRVIGAAGPTTSYRMDRYTPCLLELGIKGMIGKGPRGPEVKEAIKMHKSVYFAAIGGAGALISKTIKKAEVIAYPDLGAEAVMRLEVENFPAIVVNDIHGGDLYVAGRAEYGAEEASEDSC
ncbi:MAG TPA: Fe-S-containing hydro-lyase [Nitrospiraceae bacterium]|jgi:fumarate hydratase subunit beta|nr:Fe-S-containing hydro-lyase [Nitrospiraceae bacterium]